MLLLFCLWPFVGPSHEQLEQHYRTQIQFLASDIMEGRETATRGQRLAAEYIATQLRLWEIQPPFPENENPYLQRFEVDVKEIDEASVSCQVSGAGPAVSLGYGSDFSIRPLGLGDFDINAPMTFAGDLEDFYPFKQVPNINVKGRWVIVLNSGQRGSNPWGPPGRLLSHIANLLLEKEARGLILLQRETDDPPALIGPRRRMFLPGEFEDNSPVLPVILLPETQWPNLFGKDFEKFLKVTDKIDGPKHPQPFAVSRRKLHLKMKHGLARYTTENVVGLIPGSDPLLKDEYLVITAHYDHVGIQFGMIFNGADDNATGAATLLELARNFGKARHKRGLLLLWLTGEEVGLLGSKYFVANPVLPIEQLIADINMDMIGRNETREIGVIPSNNEDVSSLNETLKRVNREGGHDLTLLSNMDRFHSRSDHFTFVKAGIPAIFFFGGDHEHYHSPADDWQRLNYTKLANVYKLLEGFIEVLLDAEDKPAFLKTRKPGRLVKESSLAEKDHLKDLPPAAPPVPVQNY